VETTWDETISYPPDFDPELAKKFEAEHASLRRQRFEEECAAAAARIERAALATGELGEALDLSDEQRERLAAVARKQAESLEIPTKEPPGVEPMQGHNQARYAPFDFHGAATGISGIHARYLEGRPNRVNGAIGGEIVGYPPGGGGFIQNGVGVWYYARRSLTLEVSVQIRAYAQGQIVAAFPGYAESFIGVRASIYQWAAPYRNASSTTTIYDAGAAFAFHLRQGRPGEIFRASIAMPVDAGHWYMLCADAVQRAYCYVVGVAGSALYAAVGPITYVEH
jgi:hypothetical protein